MAKKKKPKIKLTKQEKQDLRELVRKYDVGLNREKVKKGFKKSPVSSTLFYTVAAPLSAPLLGLFYTECKKKTHWNHRKTEQEFYSDLYAHEVYVHIHGNLSKSFNKFSNAKTEKEKSAHYQDMKEAFDDAARLKPAIVILEDKGYGTEKLAFEVKSEIVQEDDQGFKRTEVIEKVITDLSDVGLDPEEEKKGLIRIPKPGQKR
jgi:hypothetical protein